MNESLLKGSFDKIGWARRHVQKLDAVIDREVRSRTYQLTHQYQPDSRYYEIVWDPPALDPEFGLRIGDAVHQLRSALDLAVWELTIRNGKDPESFKRPKLQFPIYSDPGDFKSTGEDQMRGVCDAAKKVIRENQPHIRGDRAFEDELAILADLDNQDKHRVITPVVASLEIDNLAIEKFLAANLGHIEPNYFVTPVGRLHEPRQRVVQFRVSDEGNQPKKQVEVAASGDVALEDGTLVIKALDDIGLRVEGVIRHLIGALS